MRGVLGNPAAGFTHFVDKEVHAKTQRSQRKRSRTQKVVHLSLFDSFDPRSVLLSLRSSRSLREISFPRSGSRKERKVREERTKRRATRFLPNYYKQRAAHLLTYNSHIFSPAVITIKCKMFSSSKNLVPVSIGRTSPSSRRFTCLLSPPCSPLAGQMSLLC